MTVRPSLASVAFSQRCGQILDAGVRFVGSMMTIFLTKILPNPFRNLELFPLDPESVAKIVISEGRHGFFGGLRARPSPTRPGFYELAFGHLICS